MVTPVEAPPCLAVVDGQPGRVPQSGGDQVGTVLAVHPGRADLRLLWIGVRPVHPAVIQN